MSSKFVQAESFFEEWSREDLEEHLAALDRGETSEPSKIIKVEVDLDGWSTEDLITEIYDRNSSSLLQECCNSTLVDAFAALLAGNQEEAINNLEKALPSDFRRNAEARAHIFKR